MFARIALRYDLANRLLSGGADLWWRRRLVRAVRQAGGAGGRGGRGAPAAVLDLATGSGDVAFALCRALPDAQVTGMDFCLPMLEQAEAKKAAAGGERAYPKLTFAQGDGMQLPLPDACVDAVTISFGLRNMADRHRSLCEMRRVLRPGGRLYVLEFSQPQRWFRPLYFFYLRRILPRVAGLVTRDRAAYVYLNESIERFPDRAALSAEIRAAGFDAVRATGMTFGIVALHEAVAAHAAS